MEKTFTVGVERGEKRYPLDMVPMEMRKKDMGADGIAVGFLHQLFAQVAETGATVEDIDTAVEAYLDAGGVTPIAQIL